MSNNVFNQSYEITCSNRRALNGHNSFLILLTGLSGSGKSTIASRLEKELYNRAVRTYSLDGDNIRIGVCNGLGFSAEDRIENLRRIGEIAKLMIDSGTVTIAAFVAPFQESREQIKKIVGDQNYIEVYVNTSIETCEKRDVKGLYAKARKGIIKDFTGISSPYETPESPNITVNTELMSVEEVVQEIIPILEKKLILQS